MATKNQGPHKRDGCLTGIKSMVSMQIRDLCSLISYYNRPWRRDVVVMVSFRENVMVGAWVMVTECL